MLPEIAIGNESFVRFSCIHIAKARPSEEFEVRRYTNGWTHGIIDMEDCMTQVIVFDNQGIVGISEAGKFQLVVDSYQ